MALTRRDYLTTSGLALGALALSAAQGHADNMPRPARVRLSLNENPFGPSCDRLKLRHTDARGNFVFFETGKPEHEIATALLARGIDIGRGHPPLDHWVRISIGLPHENDMARAAIAELLG